MEQPVVKSVGMLILRQTNIATAVEFYQKLGLRLKFHLKDAWAELVLGAVKIGLCPSGQATDYRTGVVLEVEDLKAFYAAHKEKICFIGEPKEAVHGIMVSFKDPGGNILDLYQPTPERVAELVKQAAKDDPDQCCQKNQKMGIIPSQQQCCRSKHPEACS